MGHLLVWIGMYFLIRSKPASIALDSIGNAMNGNLPASQVHSDIPLLQEQLHISGVCFSIYGVVLLVTAAMRTAKSA